MEVGNLSINTVSARGSVQEIVVPSELAEETNPSGVTGDSITFHEPMAERIEIFYGGEFLISECSNRDQIAAAKLFIEEELGLTVDEFNYHRVSINGNLEINKSEKSVEKIASRLQNLECVSDLQYGESNKFGGDIYFKLNANTVRLFIERDEPMYYIGRIAVSSMEGLSTDVRKEKERLTTVLSGECLDA